MTFTVLKLVAIIGLTTIWVQLHAEVTQDLRTIRVIGIGRIVKEANVAVIDFELTHEDQNILGGRKHMSDAMGRLMEFLSKQPAESTEVSLGILDVNRRKHRQKDRQDTYVLKKRISVDTKQLGKVDLMLEKALTFGFTTKYIRWNYRGESDLRVKLLSMASIDAKKKAKLIAEKVGAHLGRVHTIDLNYKEPIYANHLSVKGLTKSSGSRYTGAEVTAREVNFSASVEVIYELK